MINKHHDHHIRDDRGRWHCFRHVLWRQVNGSFVEADFTRLPAHTHEEAA